MPRIYPRLKNIICVALCGVMVLASSPQSYAVDSKITNADGTEQTAGKESEKEDKDDKEDKGPSKSLADAQKELEQIKSALASANELVKNLKGSKAETKKKIEALEKELENVEHNIEDIEDDITQTEAAIASTQAEIDLTVAQLEAAEEDRDRQYEDMKKRIRFMYINSNNSYIEKILTTGSVSEFLNEIRYIESITSYDQEMMDLLAQIIGEIEETRAFLDEQYASLEAQKNLLEAERNAQEENRQALQVLETARQQELSGIEEDLLDAEALAAYYEAEAKAQKEIISQIRAAEAKKAAAGGDNASKIDDRYGFLWPCPSSTRITSDYGPRTAPTAGASSNHKGIDIGAPHGSPIVASQNGTVAVASYSSSGGNYVMIDHGAGLYTVYMHASELAVSAGDEVIRGDVIAYVGSTGVSTGNHLHFAVSEDGDYVSPWNYVSR